MIIFFLCFLLWEINAQRSYFPYFNQYRFEGMVMNPAFAGSREVLSTSLFYRNSIVGHEGNPEYQTITAHSPMKNYKIGLGFLFMHQTEGIEHNYDVFFNYAYRATLRWGKLSLGLKGGFTYNVLNYGDIDLSPRYPSDPVFENLPSSESAILPNFGVGFYYYTKSFFLGGSVPLLLSQEEKESGAGLTIKHDFDKYNYIFNTGVKLGKSDGVKFVPSLLVLYIKNSPIQYIGNFSVEFLNDRFSIGAGYRAGNAFLGSLQIKANDQLKIGYTYDSTYEQKKFSIPHHEIMLRYEFRYLIKASNPVDF